MKTVENFFAKYSYLLDFYLLFLDSFIIEKILSYSLLTGTLRIYHLQT